MEQDQNANDITIESVCGPSDGQDLLQCYFRYDSTRQTYSFFDKNNQELAKDLHPGQHFRFVLPYVADTVWKLHISKNGTTPTSVTGKWKTKDMQVEAGASEEPDQSYQAQAGGTVDCETIAAAVTAN
jgi:hypothetical protein